MAAIGAHMRPLKIPPKFHPYLDQHRVYELFFDLGTLIGIHMPQDPVLYLRNVMIHLHETRDRPNLVLISPPYIDKKKFAIDLANVTGQYVMSKEDLHLTAEEETPENVALKFFQFIVENDINKKGWILFDYPQNIEEGRALLSQGVLPTHTFLIIPSAKAYSPKVLWMDNLNDLTVQEIARTWAEYRLKVLDFRKIFRSSLIEISIRMKEYEDILKDCTKRLKSFKKGQVKCTPRVVLIGTRGSRRSAIARMLSDKLNLVILDMVEIVEQASLQDNEVGEQIKFLTRRRVPIYSSIILKLLEERLLRDDCLSNGWVLVRFPRDAADLEALDNFDTPPNRVIFLATDCEESFNTLHDIRISKFNGLPTTLATIKLKGNVSEEKNYFVHPSDEDKRILLEHANYTSALEGMLDYCGESCAIVNGTGTVTEVYERVESVIVKASAVAPPRRGTLKKEPVCPPDPVDEVLVPSVADIQEGKNTFICSHDYLPKEDVLSLSRLNELEETMNYNE